MVESRIKNIAKTVSLTGLCSLAVVTSAQAYDHGIGSRAMKASVFPESADFIYISYLAYYDATQVDANGDDLPIDVTVTAQTNRLIYLPGTKLLGGDLVMNMVVPFGNVSLETSTDMFGPTGKVSNSGLMDPIFEPVALHYKGDNYEVIGGVALVVPWGDDSLTSHHYTLQPQFALTWYPTEQHDWNISFIPAYELHSPDLNEASYKEGDDFHIEWGIGRQFGPLNVGIVGYDQWQVTEDQGISSAGESVDEDEVHAIGVSAQIPSRTFNGMFEIIANHEYSAKNQTKGNRIFLNFVKAI